MRRAAYSQHLLFATGKKRENAKGSSFAYDLNGMKLGWAGVLQINLRHLRVKVDCGLQSGIASGNLLLLMIFGIFHTGTGRR